MLAFSVWFNALLHFSQESYPLCLLLWIVIWQWISMRPCLSLWKWKYLRQEKKQAQINNLTNKWTASQWRSSVQLNKRDYQYLKSSLYTMWYTATVRFGVYSGPDFKRFMSKNCVSGGAFSCSRLSDQHQTTSVLKEEREVCKGHTYRQTDRQTDRHMSARARADRQTDRHRHRHTNTRTLARTHTHIQTCAHIQAHARSHVSIK